MIGINKNEENPCIILECQICFEEYDINNKKPVVLECGHSICNICLAQILSSNNANLKKCPFDKILLTYQQIQNYPVNWSYIDIISSKY